MTEWPIVQHWKCCVLGNWDRGFESPPLRISLLAFRNPCENKELRKAFLFVSSIGAINRTNSVSEFGGFFPFLAWLGRLDLPFLHKVRAPERSDHPMRSAPPKKSIWFIFRRASAFPKWR